MQRGQEIQALTVARLRAVDPGLGDPTFDVCAAGPAAGDLCHAPSPLDDRGGQLSRTSRCRVREPACGTTLAGFLAEIGVQLIVADKGDKVSGVDLRKVIEGFGYSPDEENGPGILWADLSVSPEDLAASSAQFLKMIQPA